MRDVPGYLFAFLAGAFAGAAAGILLAPDRGKNTQERIAGGVKRAKDDVTHRVEKMEAYAQGFKKGRSCRNGLPWSSAKDA